jgi:hypothetical protein
VRIFWNDSENYFQAEFQQGDEWRNDMEAAKAAGFRTTGPPSWVWYTFKATVLNSLREHRPPSGLTLTERALAQYQKFNEEEVKKAELKKEYQKAKKAVKKLGPPSPTSLLVIPPGKIWISAEDLPPWVKLSKHVKTPWAGAECFVCSDPLIFCDYEDICVWCARVHK